MLFGTVDGKWNTEETKSNVLVNSVSNDGLAPSDTRTSIASVHLVAHYEAMGQRWELENETKIYVLCYDQSRRIKNNNRGTTNNSQTM